jgi:DNA-binding NarL/FixJ family response regulator
VGSDEGVHDFVWKAFEAHANGWTLDSHATLHSGLRAPGCALPTPHSSQSKTPASRDIAHPRTRPDVILLEAQLPGLSGIVCARRLTARLPNARIVMFTACSDHDTIVESVMAGALGYLIKPVTPEYLVWAVSEAAQGRRVLCGEAQGAAVDYIRRSGATGRSKRLSWREREVMLRLMNGAPNKDLATELGIGEGTLHKHLDNIYKKLGVHGKDDARRKFMGG